MILDFFFYFLTTLFIIGFLVDIFIFFFHKCDRNNDHE